MISGKCLFQGLKRLRNRNNKPLASRAATATEASNSARMPMVLKKNGNSRIYR